MSALTLRYAGIKRELKRLLQLNAEQWLVMGDKLRIVKEEELWREDCESWADFKRKFVAFSARFTDQLIADTKVWIPLKEVLEGNGTVFLPFTQLAAREMGKIEDSGERAAVAADAVKEAAKNGAAAVSPKHTKKALEKRAKAKVVDIQPAETSTSGYPQVNQSMTFERSDAKKVCPHCGGSGKLPLR